MEFTLKSLQLPVRLRWLRPMNDEELKQFCAANPGFRIEREADGELLVMMPSFPEGAAAELDVAGEFRNWAIADGRGRAFGPSAGFTLRDGSVRGADASWIRWERWNAFSEEERSGSFTPVCPDFVIEV